MKSQIVNSVRRGGSVLAAVAFAFVASTSANAASIPSLATGTSFQFGYNGSVTGWSNDASNSTAYNFDLSTATASSANSFGNTTTMDSATTVDAACPACSVLALDSVFETGKVGTTISGLTANVSYTLTFNFAASQQKGFTGGSTDYLTVYFGGTSAGNTQTLSIPSQGFSGWNSESFSFVASGASETLSFLATGTPTGANQDPAFALVDNLNIAQTAPTPEPSSLMLLGTGLAGLGGLVRSRFSKRS